MGAVGSRALRVWLRPGWLAGWLATVVVMVALGGRDGWRMTDLEMLPAGRNGLAAGVNDEGIVVGVSETGEETDHAALWHEGHIWDLGTLGGLNSAASDVNRHGVVVGSSEVRADIAGMYHAFIWSDGRMIDLGTLGGDVALAAAISDDGWVVGCSRTATNAMHAFVWEAGEMIDLGTLPGRHQSSRAHDIDNRGRIVGEATVDKMNTVPVIWEGGRIQPLSDRLGRAIAISSRGEVTGGLSTGAESFVWSRDALTVIGPVDGEMYVQTCGIDREGRVVGSTGFKAFVWHGGTFEWLSGLSTGWVAVRAISDSGRFVVGASTSTPDGLTPRPVMWTRR